MFWSYGLHNLQVNWDLVPLQCEVTYRLEGNYYNTWKVS